MPATKSQAPELLAPAGSPEALRAAVNNGADAVYLGLGKLNARRSATNFTLESLSEACDFAHLRKARVYLTLNVLILADEMDEALDLVEQAWSAGVDAVIVQDLGLLQCLRAALPHVRVHASTQMNAHNSATVVQLGTLGVSRVTLAREVSIAEIARFVEESAVEVEAFVHGALCMCYSGQCLLSSLIGARSANRGLCAQPCRLPYELASETGQALVTDGAHLLSPKDLAGIALLPELVKTGVSALKIEGRMKSPEYVALVTGVYRRALDRAIQEAEGYRVRDGDVQVLEEAFSRGFTSAYFEGERGNAMMSYRRPNNRGVPVGRVVATSQGTAEIALDVALESGDTLEFWTAKGRFGQRVGALTHNGGSHSSAPAGAKATIEVEGATRPGDRVFRVANAALLTAARRSFEGDAPGRGVPLSLSIVLRRGEPLTVTVTDDADRVATATGSVVEAARTKPVSAEEVIEHVGRLGGTPYTAGSWDVELTPGVGVGFSELHRVRREAIESYERLVLTPWKQRPRVGRSHKQAAPAQRSSRKRPSARVSRLGVELVASVERFALAEAALEAGADVVHVPVWELHGSDGATSEALTGRIVPLVPRIVHDREVVVAERVLRGRGRAVVGNLGLLARAVGAGLSVEAHWGLNAVNPWTVSALGGLGAGLVWLSPELSRAQTLELARGSEVPLGVSVYGRQEVMVTEHCILMSEGECDKRCGGCERRGTARILRDRKGYRFPVMTDLQGRSHLFNAVPLDLSMELPDIVESGLAAVRADFTIESPEEVARIVSRLRRALDSISAGAPVCEPLVQPGTTGHYFRGVR